MNLVAEVLDLQIEEKMQKKKTIFLKVIEIIIKKDLINHFTIEGLLSNREVLKIYLIGLIQQLEEEKSIMNQI
jgi:hypothetical protein